MNELVKSTALSDYLGSGGAQLLIFRQGDFSSGDSQIALGTRFVARPLEHRIGWQRWADQKPAETILGYLHEGYVKPDRSRLGFLDESQWDLDQNGKPRDPWQLSESIPFIADNGEEFLFVTGSWGGHCGLVKLQKAYGLMDQGAIR